MKLSLKRIYITHRDWVLFGMMVVLGIGLALTTLKSEAALSCVEKAQELSVVANLANHTELYPDKDYVVYHPLGTSYRVNTDIVNKCFQ